MKALYYRGGIGGLEWREDPMPEILAPSDALARPSARFKPVFVRDPINLN